MATNLSGKSVDRSTEWSDWELDPQGFWFCSRFGPTGEVEFQYNEQYTSFLNSQTYQGAPQSEDQSISSTPRYNEFSESLDHFEASTELSSNPQYSPAYTHIPPTSSQSTSTQLHDDFKPTYSISASYKNSANCIDVQESTSGTQPYSNWPSGSTGSSNLHGRCPESEDNDPINNMSHKYSELSVGSPSKNPKEFLTDNSTHGSSGGKRNETTIDTRAKALNCRYKVVEIKKLKSFWKVGRVFMTLWIEPARETPNGPSRPQTTTGQWSTTSTARFINSEFATTDGWLGGTAYFEIRRFAVVKMNYGNAQCSPIHSYSGQATLKPNLSDVGQHAIIYTSKDPPKAHSEFWDGKWIYEKLKIPPIKVVSERPPSDRDGDLGLVSRINFSKVYTVEIYARVLNVGMIHPDHLEVFSKYASESREEPAQPPVTRPPASGQGDNHNSRGSSSKAASNLRDELPEAANRPLSKGKGKDTKGSPSKTPEQKKKKR